MLDIDHFIDHRNEHVFGTGGAGRPRCGSVAAKRIGRRSLCTVETPLGSIDEQWIVRHPRRSQDVVGFDCHDARLIFEIGDGLGDARCGVDRDEFDIGGDPLGPDGGGAHELSDGLGPHASLLAFRGVGVEGDDDFTGNEFRLSTS